MNRTLAIRLALIAVAVALVGWGLRFERHRIVPLTGGEARQADGIAFTSDATVDGYVRIKGELFDAYTPLTPGQVQLKDCKT